MVVDDTEVWKALSDPSRRQILDILRINPHTTGQLSSQFEDKMSRIAVMKHLKILKGANLITDKNKGREHWYFINAVPLQEIYNRWMRPFEEHWAQSLINLKNNIETSEEEMENIQVIEILQNIQIKATPKKVFNALTHDISNWWGRPYIINEEATALTLEPRLGGLLYESWGDNQGYVWGQVTYLKTNEVLEITGPFGMTKAFYGRLCLTLTEKDNVTNVELSHRAYGELDEQTKQGYGTGWQDLVGERLKKFVEEGVKLGLGHEPPMKESSSK